MIKNVSNKAIIVVSIVIPLVVAVLLFLPTKLALAEDFVAILPDINAFINSLTALCLIMGLIFIKSDNVSLHKKLMITAFILGVCFLLSYVLYHASVESTIYGDINGDGTLSEVERAEAGMRRNIYLFVLLSHILLAISVVPLVLFAMHFALNGKFEAHKRIVKFAYPVWLYVSITGVVVYLMIKPFYT